jgi:hypothetical protein
VRKLAVGEVERVVSEGCTAICWSGNDGPKSLEFRDAVKSMGSSEGQDEYDGADGAGLVVVCGGLGFPRMAERIEYSRFAASDPNGKLGSNGTGVNI